MLSAINRFHGRRSIGFVYRNGQSVRDRFFSIKFIANPRRKASRISIVVSRKTCKFAVGRNRIRRRIYEIIRHRLDRFSTAYDIVITVTTSEAIEMPHQDLSSNIDKLLTKANIL